MSDSELDIIATRTIWEEQIVGEPLPITINICRPILFKDPESIGWECSHQILRNSKNIGRMGFGVDSIQALYSSLLIAGLELSTSNIQTPQEDNEYGMWNKENNFGFPRFEKVVDSDILEIDEDDNE